MGAQLACVSCSQVKDKDNEPPYNSTKGNKYKQTSDHPDKTTSASLNQIHLNINNDKAATKQPAQTEQQEDCDDDCIYISRMSALEIHKVIKENTINNNSSSRKLDEVGDDENEEETDIDKAAKAIVDMSLFITTKIIYPAYVKYLEMDHPDLYEEYFSEKQQETQANISSGAIRFCEHNGDDDVKISPRFKNKVNFE